MKTFCVASLPRSRSAWFTVALNTCTPIRACHEMYGKAQLGYNYMNDSWDCSVGSDAIVPSCQTMFLPNAKHFFLYRNPEECKASLIRAGVFNYDSWVTQTLWADRYIDLYKPIVIGYNGLDGAVIKLASHVGVDVDTTMLKEMLDMRITSKLYKDSV